MFAEIATVGVEEDIARLTGGCIRIFRRSFFQPVLFLEVLQRDNSETLFNWIEQHNFQSEMGIVFGLSNRESERISAFLNTKGIASAFYHNVMNPDQIQEVIANWEQGAIKTLVMTPGFEIPFDDVTYCVYFGLPRNLETFFLHCSHTKTRCAVMTNRMDEMILKRIVKTEVELNSVITFVSNSSRCRHEAIAAHFGEVVKSTCGTHCDVCSHKRENSAMQTAMNSDLPGLVAHLNCQGAMQTTSALICAVLRGESGADCPWFGRLAHVGKSEILDALDYLVERGDLKIVATCGKHGIVRHFHAVAQC
jgi:superfamily II DNA helicase RecQ